MCHLCNARNKASETYAKIHAFVKPEFENDQRFQDVKSWHITDILYFLPETQPVYLVEVYIDTKGGGHGHTRCFIKENLEDHTFSIISSISIARELSNPLPSHVHNAAQYPDAQ